MDAGQQAPWTSRDVYLSNAAYERCLKNLQVVSLVSAYARHDLQVIPSRDVLDSLIRGFFQNHCLDYPFIHGPTFNCDTCHWVHWLAVASLAAKCHERDPASLQIARVLTALAIRALGYVAQQNPDYLKQMWYHQSLLMVVSTGLTASEAFHHSWALLKTDLMVNQCTQLDWLLPSRLDVHEESEGMLPLRQRWIRWAERENMKRIGLSIFTCEALSSVLWSTFRTDMYQQAGRVPLPCPDTLWKAKDAEEWAAQFAPATLPTEARTMEQVFREACNSEEHTAALNSFGSWFGVITFQLYTHTLVNKTRRVLLALQMLPDGLQENTLLALETDRMPKLAHLYGLVEKLCIPLEDSEHEAAVASRLRHLQGLADGLPLNFLQQYARQCAAAGRLVEGPIVRKWLDSQQGVIGRRTCYHAGQLFALKNEPTLVRSRKADIFEVYGLFYAAIVVMLFTRYGTPKRPVLMEPEFNIVSRFSCDDPVLVKWINDGYGVPCLPVLGQLNGPGTEREVSLRVLGALYDILAELYKTFHIPLAAQLGNVLLHLVQLGSKDKQLRSPIPGISPLPSLDFSPAAGPVASSSKKATSA